MKEGSTVGDFSVTIGSEVCSDVKVFINSLSCRPPKSEPPKVMNTSNNDAHLVYVRFFLVS